MKLNSQVPRSYVEENQNLPQNRGQRRIHPTSIWPSHYRRESVLFGGWMYAYLMFGPLRNMIICAPGDQET